MLGHDEFRQRLAALSARERWLALCALVLIGGYAAFDLIWQPLRDSGEQARQLLEAKQRDYRYLRQVAEQVAALGGEGNGRDQDARPAAETIAQSSRQLGLAQAVGPALAEGERQFSVTVAGADFDRLIVWLAALADKHGARIVGIELTRHLQQPGMVDGKLILAF